MSLCIRYLGYDASDSFVQPNDAILFSSFLCRFYRSGSFIEFPRHLDLQIRQQRANTFEERVCVYVRRLANKKKALE